MTKSGPVLKIVVRNLNHHLSRIQLWFVNSFNIFIAKMGREGRGERGSAADRAAAAAGNSNNSLAVPRLSVCADVQKVDRSKLAQTEFAIIEFDAETFRLLLDYLHTGSCPCTCNNIPGLICAAEHYDLPELLQACFHHAKQFLRIEVVRILIISNY